MPNEVNGEFQNLLQIEEKNLSYCENKYSTFCGIFPSFFFTHQDTFYPKGYQMHFRLHNTYLSKHSVIQSYDNYC